MTAADFRKKWDLRFQDNSTFEIDEADLREFKDDCVLLFGSGSLKISRTLDLLAAQQEAAAKDVGANVLYAVESTLWNNRTASATVYVHGLNPDSYAPIGYVYLKGWELVAVDVKAGTFQAFAPPGAGVAPAYTAAPLAAAQPVFELSPALAALGKGRLRLLISPASTPPPPVPNGGFPYAFPASIP